MAHKTLINGTAYDINGGKTLVNGTAYSVNGGKTLVNGTAYDISVGKIVVPTFADATWDEIVKVCEAHYLNKIDISEYWNIGDTKTVSISAISASSIGNAQPQQNAKIAIIGIEHDNLVTPINGHTKSCITLQLVNCLSTYGEMNSIQTTEGGWDSSPRRSWCNNEFKSALPISLQNGIKRVEKIAKNGRSYTNLITSNDYCFLVCEVEVFGYTRYSISGEGHQYPYYTNTSTRVKKLGDNASSAYFWFERSPSISTSGYPADYNTYFCGVDAGGGINETLANSNRGICPAFCI